MRFPPPPREEALEPVIPLINVVFLLLVFFMLSGEINRHGQIEVTPPQSEAETGQAAPSGIVIQISREGSVTLNGERIELPALPARAMVLQNSDTSEPWLIFADRQATAGVLNRVINHLRDSGVQEVRLITDIGVNP